MISGTAGAPRVATREAAMAKLFASEAAWRVTNRAVQVLATKRLQDEQVNSGFGELPAP